MSTQYDTSLSTIFVACREYYLQGQSRPLHRRHGLFGKISEALNSILTFFSQAHEHLYPGWTADGDHPGYLIRFEPPMALRVPYHLMPVFPTGEALHDLWRLSRGIRSAEDSIICLSGSNGIRRIFDWTNDVDFCEYLILTGAPATEQLVANLDVSGDLFCMKVAVSDQSWHFPWKEGKPREDVFLKNLDPSNTNRSFCKFDYLGTVGSLGISAISNLVLACDESGHSAGSQRTFAAQEALFSAADWIPNTLNDVVEMGRYIDWLLREIQRCEQSREFERCIKRCASLSRVVFIPEVTNAIGDIASKSAVLLAHKLSRQRELQKQLRTGPLSSMADRLNEQISRDQLDLSNLGGAPSPADIGEFGARVTAIVERLVAAFGNSVLRKPRGVLK